MFPHNKAIHHRILSTFLAVLMIFSVGTLMVSAQDPVGSGTTYYISDSLGNDENDGLSEETPWKTIERLATVSLTAGDTVRFKSGDIWYGAFELDVSGGEKDNPITFTSYGEGEKPSLRYYTGNVTPVASGICLILHNANGFVMDGLDVGYANLGIKIVYDADSINNEYVRFTNCHFHDIHGVHQLDYMEEIYFSAAITTEHDGSAECNPDGTNWPLKGLYIDHCTTYDAGSLVSGPTGVYGLYVSDCICENNGYYGTTAFGCQEGFIERCIFRNNGTRDMPPGSCGIMLALKDFTVRNCIIMGQQRQGSDPDGCGIDFEMGCENVTIENCLFQENAGVGLMYFTSGLLADGTNRDTHIRNCYFVNNNVNIGNIGGFEIFSSSYGADNCEVTGNKWIVTDMKLSETVDFSMVLDNNNILFENNTLMEEIPENLEAMILNPEVNNADPEVNNTDPAAAKAALIVSCIITSVITIGITVICWLIVRSALKKSRK